MKKISVFLIFLSFSFETVHAQTWDEWFSQKKTQIKYLTQQLAALQMYESYLSKGYKIADQGLRATGKIKDGEFNLHQVFFSSLSTINPSIKNDFRIAGIIALQLSIDKQYRSCYQNAEKKGLVSPDELSYIHSVFENLLNGCTGNMDDLISITTSGQLQLSDDERLQRIDAIDQDMKDKYQFAQSFSNETNKLIMNRQKGQNEISSTKTLYNLK